MCRQFRKLERRKSTNTASSGGGDRGGGVNEELEEDENEENENEQNTNNNSNNNESAAYDIAIVPMDGYHYYRSQLEKMDNPQHALAKRGAPFTFDSERFVNDIVNLRKTGSGSFPSFDHGKGDPVENDILVEYKRHKIILVEGNYLFLPEQPWSRLLDETCFDEAWYVNCPVDEATKRVIDRHVRTGKTKETAELRAYSNDLANAKLVDAAAPSNSKPREVNHSAVLVVNKNKRSHPFSEACSSKYDNKASPLPSRLYSLATAKEPIS